MLTDIVCLQWNSAGVQQWTKMFGSSTRVSGMNNALTQGNHVTVRDGNVYACANTKVSWNGQTAIANGLNGATMKLNSEGEAQWTRFYAEANNFVSCSE